MEAARKESTAIGLDLDGVIVDHTENKLAISKLLGFEVGPGETPSDIFNLKISPETKSRADYLLYDHPEYAMKPTLIEGARRSLESIRKSGAPYFLISRRKNPGTAIKLLKKHGLWPGVFNERNAFFVNSKIDKNSKAAELGIDIYMDDQPSVLEELKTVKHKFLFDPHAAYSGMKGKYSKIHSWREFLEGIRRLS